jgi:1-acyl-sn-glycerol-3-phosphate acyltransferase
MGQSKALYAVGKAVCKPVFKLLYRYKTIIEEPLPLVGGMIIASNHISNSDPVLLGLSQKKRRLFFMAKIELFKNRFFGALIRALGAFPVERGAGDGKAIKTGEDLIRDGELMRPRSGCALVAQQMQVPVVPACITIVGNKKHTFAKRVIHFGKPLTPEKLGLTPDSGRRELKGATTMIMDEIKRMREQDLIEYKKG